MATSSLMKKLQKSTNIKEASVLSDSELFNEKDVIQTSIPAINIALSGDLDGGLRAGITSIAGESRNFKSSYALLMASAYCKKYPDAIVLFYDSEFGFSADTVASFGIDPTQVLHIPVMNIEELKFDLMTKFDNGNTDGIKRGDRVFVLVDSIGNLSSSKETADSLKENGASDMGTRAKSLKSMFRLITPHLTMKNIPMVVIQHVYKEMGLYPKTIMSGGSGGMLSSDTVWIVGKSQEKEGTELIGYNFTINVEKSRYVKEKTKIPITVTFDGGISRYTGMLDLAVEAGEVKSSAGWYQLLDKETGELLDVKKRFRDTQTDEFLGTVIRRESFRQWIRDRYKLSQAKMLEDELEELAATEE